MDKPNVAVVGYGLAGRCFHAYLVGLVPDLKLRAVVSSRPEARETIEHDLGAIAYADFEQLLTDDAVDLVVLATPNDLHAPQAIAALAAGKHVVTDKPMALDRREADLMIAAAVKHDRLLTVFQNRRWDADYLTIRRAIEDGRVGQPFRLELAWMAHAPPRTWRGERIHGGGKFVDFGAHLIDQALQLIPGRVNRVYARFQSGLWENDVEDHAECTIGFAEGVEVQITTSSAAPQAKPRWLVMGSGGTLIQKGLDPQEKAMVAGDIDAAAEVPAHRVVHVPAGGGAAEELETVPGRWRSYYENIAAAILGRAELSVTAASVRRGMAVIDAARQSAATGQAVEVDDMAPA